METEEKMGLVTTHFECLYLIYTHKKIHTQTNKQKKKCCFVDIFIQTLEVYFLTNAVCS